MPAETQHELSLWGMWCNSTLCLTLMCYPMFQGSNETSTDLISIGKELHSMKIFQWNTNSILSECQFWLDSHWGSIILFLGHKNTDLYILLISQSLTIPHSDWFLQGMQEGKSKLNWKLGRNMEKSLTQHHVVFEDLLML